MDAILSTQRRRLLASLGGAAALALAGCSRPSGKAQVRFAGETMGTTFNVKLARGSQADRLPVLHQAVPAAFDGSWAWDDLVGAVTDALDSAKLRAIEPVHLDTTAYDAFVPATHSAWTA